MQCMLHSYTHLQCLDRSHVSTSTKYLRAKDRAKGGGIERLARRQSENGISPTDDHKIDRAQGPSES